MSTPALVIPRLEIDVIDKNGKMDRNWYKYLALLGKSIGPSLTNSDDLQSFENMDGASLEALAISALNIANAATVAAAAASAAAANALQGNLMGWWPGDSK